MDERFSVVGTRKNGGQVRILFSDGVNEIPVTEDDSVPPNALDGLEFLGSAWIGAWGDRVEFEARDGVSVFDYPHHDGEHQGRTYNIAVVNPGQSIIARPARSNTNFMRGYTEVFIQHEQDEA